MSACVCVCLRASACVCVFVCLARHDLAFLGAASLAANADVKATLRDVDDYLERLYDEGQQKIMGSRFILQVWLLVFFFF